MTEPIEAEVAEPKITAEAMETWQIWLMSEDREYPYPWLLYRGFDTEKQAIDYVKRHHFVARIVHISLPAID